MPNSIGGMSVPGQVPGSASSMLGLNDPLSTMTEEERIRRKKLMSAANGNPAAYGDMTMGGSAAAMLLGHQS